MDFNEFENRIQEIAKNCQDYTKRRESLFSQNWNNQANASSISLAGASTDDHLKGEYDTLHNTIGDVCAEYLVTKQRERARELAGQHPDLLRQLTNHLGWSVRKVLTKADEKYLIRGLAAISMGDLRTDVRDLSQALGQAYLNCYRVGVFMSVPLVRVAEMSNPNPRSPGMTSTREFLLNFEESAYFKSSVSPKLK